MRCEAVALWALHMCWLLQAQGGLTEGGEAPPE